MNQYDYFAMNAADRAKYDAQQTVIGNGDPTLAKIITILREAREEFEFSFGADGCLNRRIDAARSIA